MELKRITHENADQLGRLDVNVWSLTLALSSLQCISFLCHFSSVLLAVALAWAYFVIINDRIFHFIVFGQFYAWLLSGDPLNEYRPTTQWRYATVLAFPDEIYFIVPHNTLIMHQLPKESSLQSQSPSYFHSTSTSTANISNLPSVSIPSSSSDNATRKEFQISSRTYVSNISFDTRLELGCYPEQY